LGYPKNGRNRRAALLAGHRHIAGCLPAAGGLRTALSLPETRQIAFPHLDAGDKLGEFDSFFLRNPQYKSFFSGQ
jgi:hypothetical protein